MTRARHTKGQENCKKEFTWRHAQRHSTLQQSTVRGFRFEGSSTRATSSPSGDIRARMSICSRSRPQQQQGLLVCYWYSLSRICHTPHFAYLLENQQHCVQPFIVLRQIKDIDPKVERSLAGFLHVGIAKQWFKGIVMSLRNTKWNSQLST